MHRQRPYDNPPSLQASAFQMHDKKGACTKNRHGHIALESFTVLAHQTTVAVRYP